MSKLYKPGSLKELRELVNNETVCLGDIDTSLITDMSWLFCDSKRTDFDGLETWNTSHVTTMERMFLRQIFQPSHRKLGRFVRNEHGMHLLRLQQF